jgi:predicted RNase H-like HicB family nuclease
MQFPVLVEKVKGNGYRARGSEPFALSARGATREQAIAKLQTKIQTRLQKEKSEIVAIEIGAQPHPWMQFAGMFKDEPLFDDWQNAIEEYRRKVDSEPDIA